MPKMNAAQEGMNLQDFIKKELQLKAERPSIREWLEQTRQAKPLSTKRGAATILRQLRDSG